MKNQIINTSSEITLQRFSKWNNKFLLLKTIPPNEMLKQLKDVANEQHPFTKSLFIT